MFNKSLLEKPWKANIPIVNLVTSDPRATIKKEWDLFINLKQDKQIEEWNLLLGLYNQEADNIPSSFRSWLKDRAKEQESSVEILSTNPTECLNWFYKYLLVKKEDDFFPIILFFHNSHLFLSNESVQQAICNLREPLKQNHCILVLLTPEEVSFQSGPTVIKGLPTSIKEDVLILEEANFCDEEILTELKSFTDSYRGQEIYNLMLEKEDKTIELLRGFTPFQTEQLIALSLSKDKGIDLEYLAAERLKLIQGTGGLNLYKRKETFSDIQGCDNVKQFLGRILKNETRSPKAIVFIDEIEKALAGIAGDLSGVSQDYLGQMLSWMQDKNVAGMLFVGPPGTAKSALAKIAGNEGQIPSLIFDLGSLRGSLVGESEKNLRKALKMINTISQERILLIATSNNIDILPPELKRRFNLGTFFFDLPSAQERRAIWDEYIKKFNLTIDEFTLDSNLDNNWTGAEIRNCCDIANRLQCSLEEASKFIVPVYKFDKPKIDSLRAKAHDKYISASYSGTYKYQGKFEREQTDKQPSRDIKL